MNFSESAQTASLCKVNVPLQQSRFVFVLLDTREAGLLFSYAKDVSESGVLDRDETLEDETGGKLNASLFFCGRHVECLAVPVCSGLHQRRVHCESAKAEGPGQSGAFLWHHLQFYIQARPGLLCVQGHQVTMVSSPF